jgi:ubiquinol-cytochrome c reductase iron-sulfur subunit
MSEATAPTEPKVNRRDFLFIATGAVGVAGTALAAWPLVDQMSPSADTLAASAPLSVDVSKMEPGQQVLVTWQSLPIFIVRRTPAILDQLRQSTLLDRLGDPASKQMQQPAYATNWSRSIDPEYLVLVGVCTHLGCIPQFKPMPGDVDADWLGGYFCPCHGSKYDLAGRVFKGVPAPLNLPVPPHRFEGKTTLVIGENPPGIAFSLSQVETL